MTTATPYVHYGTRHNAHYRCYLSAGKTLATLSAYQIGRFPYALLKEFGLVEEASRLTQGAAR